MACALPTTVEEFNVAAAPNLAAIPSTARLCDRLKEVTSLVIGKERGSRNNRATK